MKLISEEILSKEKRKTASKTELIEAYEELESVLLNILDDGLAKMYDVNSKKLEQLVESLDSIKIQITEEKDEKLFDRWLRYIEKSKQIAEGQKYLLENSRLSRLLSEKSKSHVTKYVKN